MVRKAVALGVVALLSVPAIGDASEHFAHTRYVRDVSLTVKASAMKDGVLKTGSMTLSFEINQGVEYFVPANTGRLDEQAIEGFTGFGHYIPQGVFDPSGIQSYTGLPRFTGCLTLRIPQVIDIRNRCAINGAPYFESDPFLDVVDVGVQFGYPDGHPKADTRQTIVLSLEGLGDLIEESGNNQSVTPNVTPRTAGYAADIDQMWRRDSAILVAGQVSDSGGSLIYLNAQSASVRLRTGFRHDSYVLRGPFFCAEPSGTPIGYPAAGPILEEQLGLGHLAHPDLDGDGEGEYLQVPPGCYPDRFLPE